MKHKSLFITFYKFSVTALELNRNFIGVELDKTYFDLGEKALQRITRYRSNDSIYERLEEL